MSTPGHAADGTPDPTPRVGTHDGVRLVPLTSADVSWLHTTDDTGQRREALSRLNHGFNRAPTNVAEAVKDAIGKILRERPYCAPEHVVEAILNELGWSDPEAKP